MKINNIGYLSLLFNRPLLTKWMRKIKKVIKWYEKANNTTIDALAVCGVSGIAVGSIVAHYLRKRLLIVRKHDDKSTHSHIYVEGMETSGKSNNYIFFDDLISSGMTMAYVTAMIEHQWRDLVQAPQFFDDTTKTKQPKMVAVALYSDCPTLSEDSIKVSFNWNNAFAQRIRDGLIRWNSKMFWKIKDVPFDQYNDYCRGLVPTEYTIIG